MNAPSCGQTRGGCFLSKGSSEPSRTTGCRSHQGVACESHSTRHSDLVVAGADQIKPALSALSSLDRIFLRNAASVQADDDLEEVLRCPVARPRQCDAVVAQIGRIHDACMALRRRRCTRQQGRRRRAARRALRPERTSWGRLGADRMAFTPRGREI